MTKLSNDKIERHYFEKFRKKYALPNGSVKYGDKPDVIVRGPRKIGIEITRFFVQPGELSGTEQQQKQFRDEVIADAHKFYVEGGGKRVEFTFSFDKNVPIVPGRKKALSKGLAAFTLSHDDQSSGEIYRHLFRDAMPELWSIYFNPREYADAQWRIMQVHTVGLMSNGALEMIVREKESKVKQYEACDAYWLLLVVDGIDAAQEQEIRIDDLDVDSSVFEKIIIFHTFGHFVEIATTADHD